MGQGESIPEYKIDPITGKGSKDVFKYKQYKLFKDYRLGGGSYGNVYKGYDTQKRRHIAAKEILDDSAQCSQKEVDILRNLTDHDNIVKLYDTFIHNGTRYIIMQLCEGLCLDKFLIEKNPDIDVRFEIISQLIETLQYVHFNTSPTAHRDIKPGNIIIVHGSHVKLCDFGLAKFVDINKTLNATHAGGTPFYMSPETYTESRYNPFKADVFAAGLVFLAIMTYVVGERVGHVFCLGGGIGSLMVNNPDALQKKLDGLDYACERTKALISLIARMVKFKPQERPDFNEIFEIFTTTVVQGKTVRKAVEDSRSDTAGRDAPTDPTPSVPQGGARPKERTQRAAEKLGIRAKSRSKPTSSGDQKPGPSGDQRSIARVRGVPRIQQRLARREGFNGDWRAGVSERGHVAMEDKWDRHISLLHDPQCQDAARFKLPDEVGCGCYKAVDASGRVLVQALRKDADTLCLDSKGRVIDRSKSSGWLLTCMGDGTLCYGERIAVTEDNYRIRLQRGGDGTPTYLEPPGRWDHDLSVCRNNDGAYCVTEWLTRSLDFFTAAGDHIRHEDLPYHPIHRNGIAATSSGHVLIAEDAAIHIHDESGRRVGGFTEQQMQVEEGCIFGISYCREDDTLTVLAGEHLTIRSVQTFRIEYK